LSIKSSIDDEFRRGLVSIVQDSSRSSVFVALDDRGEKFLNDTKREATHTVQRIDETGSYDLAVDVIEKLNRDTSQNYSIPPEALFDLQRHFGDGSVLDVSLNYYSRRATEGAESPRQPYTEDSRISIHPWAVFFPISSFVSSLSTKKRLLQYAEFLGYVQIMQLSISSTLNFLKKTSEEETVWRNNEMLTTLSDRIEKLIKYKGNVEKTISFLQHYAKENSQDQVDELLVRSCDFHEKLNTEELTSDWLKQELLQLSLEWTAIMGGFVDNFACHLETIMQQFETLGSEDDWGNAFVGYNNLGRSITRRKLLAK